MAVELYEWSRIYWTPGHLEHVRQFRYYTTTSRNSNSDTYLHVPDYLAISTWPYSPVTTKILGLKLYHVNLLWWWPTPTDQWNNTAIKHQQFQIQNIIIVTHEKDMGDQFLLCQQNGIIWLLYHLKWHQLRTSTRLHFLK